MYKKFAIIIFILISLGAGVFWLTKEKNPNSENIKTEVASLEELSLEEYDKVKNELVAIMKEQDPRAALLELRERIKDDDALLRSCHAIVHDLGHVAYEHYKDFGEAMKYQDEICNSGYLHGIIETHFSKSDDVFDEMKVVCDPYPVEKYLSWECYHGVGHGVMYYTDNDLIKSLELCGVYENSFARSTCTNGVFMENFNVDQKLHVSKFLNPNDPFYPCGEQASDQKADCYLYAPIYYLSLHKNDYKGALKWCEGTELPYESTCVQGVGAQAIKENLNTPKFVEQICMNGRSAQVGACIRGMVGLFINHHGSLEPAQDLCEKLRITNREACYDAIELSSPLFETTLQFN